MGTRAGARAATAVLALVLTSPLVAGCGDDDPPSAGRAEPASSPAAPSDSTTRAPGSSPAAPSTPPTVSPPAAPPAPGAVRPTLTSLDDLAAQPPDGTDVRYVREVGSTDAFQRYEITFRSSGRLVTGSLTRPRGRGPFPAVVTNHGFIPPDNYRIGQGLVEDEQALARAGFVSLHPDYRGYGGSDPLLPLEHELRLVYTQDAVNAAAALRTLSFVDPGRLAMVGRSMGGGITLNAITSHPRVVRAAVAYAPVSSDFVEGIDVLTRPGGEADVQAMFDAFGTPDDDPDFYEALSSRSRFDQVRAAVLLQHGTADDVCPERWSLDTQRFLTRAGVDSELLLYEGEGHIFTQQWRLAFDRTIAFLRDELDVR